MLVYLIFALCIIGLIHIAAHYQLARAHSRNTPAKPFVQSLFYCAKPLPVFILAGVLYWQQPESTYRNWVIAALLFSALGDIYLMLAAERFINGLCSFFIAHLAYCMAFYQVMSEFSFSFHGYSLLLFVSLIIAASLIIVYLWSGIEPPLRLAVCAYVSVIILMCWFAGQWYLATGNSSSTLAFLGALIFMLSDSVLAIDKFRFQFYAAVCIIMCSYYMAQILLALSVIV